MYEELVERLRDAAKMIEALAVLLPHSEGNAMAKLHKEAADAIEELEALSRRQEVELVELTGELASKPRWVPVTERLPESEEINIDHIADDLRRAYQDGYNEAYSKVLERIHSELEHFCVFLGLRYPAPENAPENCMRRGDENIRAWIAYMEKCQERGYYEATAAVTNADRIRSMSDEELAELWWKYMDCGDCPAHIDCGLPGPDCKEAALDWLREESEI